MEKAMFGAGCFWGVQAEFDALPGVISSRVGYAGGVRDNPTYEQVCTDSTGHAEVVEVIFDPTRLAYEALLRRFFDLHDPTQLNRQGPDIGTQYRSVIFVMDEAQRTSAEAVKAEELTCRPVVTTIETAPTLWPAEDYHQKYLEKRGRTSCHL